MTIFKYELEKIIKNKAFMGTCIVLLMSIFAIVYVGFFQSQLNNGMIGNSSGSINVLEQKISNANRYAGDLTDTKVETIVMNYLKTFQDRLKDEKEIKFFDYFPWYVTDLFVKNDEDIYTAMKKAVENDKRITLDDIKLIPVKNIGFAHTGKPIKIGNFLSWSNLFEVMSSLFIPIALTVILFCSLIFANDTSKNIAPLLLSTKFGRTKMIVSKILVGTFLAIIIFVIVQLLIALIFGFYYGFSGWDVSIQANLNWQLFNFPLSWNNLQVYIFSLGFQMVGILFIASLTLFVSSVSKSPFSALALSLGLFFLPQVLTQIFKRGIVNKCFYLFPANTFEIKQLLSDTNQDSMFFFGSFIPNILLILGCMFIGIIMMDFIIYRQMKKNNLDTKLIYFYRRNFI